MNTADMEQSYLKSYEELADPLFRHIFFRVHTKEVAQDLLQDTFTRVWQYISEGKTIDNMKAFLYRTAHNLVIDYYREKKEVSLDAMHEEGFDAPDTRSNSPYVGAEMAQFEKALATLPEDYREAVRMRLVEDLTPEEIAEVLGEKANAVSVRIHRGVEMIRKEMKINRE